MRTEAEKRDKRIDHLHKTISDVHALYAQDPSELKYLYRLKGLKREVQRLESMRLIGFDRVLTLAKETLEGNIKVDKAIDKISELLLGINVEWYKPEERIILKLFSQYLVLRQLHEE